MSLTRMMRYFVIAVMFHAALLFVLGSIKIVAYLPKIIARFEDVPLPRADEPEDPTAVYREFEYSGPTLGAGGGDGKKGPGGVPTAGGGTPDKYNASILTSSPNAGAPNTVGEVLGVVSAGDAFSRPLGGGSGPTGLGLGDSKIGTGGIKGPGGLLGARMGPVRSVNLHKHGGTEATEKAVLAALRWLKEHQQADGSWQLTASPHAAAGLAVLCFLGHGETPDTSQEFGLTVQNGLNYLVNSLQSDGLVPGGNMYAQGIVTLALSEGYAMTQSPQLREPAERALKVILAAQNTGKANPAHANGWRYAPTSNDSDVSVAGWQVMAMKSAKNAGLDVPQDAFDKAAQYMWRMFGGNGFGYDGPGAGLATTGIGTLCLQFMGHAQDPRLQKALDFMHQQKVDWEKTEGGFVLYAWYYITQAMFQGGGSNWDYWNRQIRDTVVKNQFEDGHWQPPTKSGEAKSVAEPVYATTLSVLILEVYYRYLPIYTLMEGAGLPANPAVPAANK